MASNTVIRTNILALNSHRNLGLVGTQQARSSQRLSSGYRINSAADDAAGLAISEKMRAQIRGLNQAERNTQDGISLIQTAEGGMQEIDNMVQRIRELIVYASNDHMEQVAEGEERAVQGDRQKIQNEINQLMQEIDSMAHRVEFNRKRLIDGSWAGPVAGTPVGVESMAALSAAITNHHNTLQNNVTIANALQAAALAERTTARSTAVSAMSTMRTALRAAANDVPGISTTATATWIQIDGLLSGLDLNTATRDQFEGVLAGIRNMAAANPNDPDPDGGTARNHFMNILNDYAADVFMAIDRVQAANAAVIETGAAAEQAQATLDAFRELGGVDHAVSAYVTTVPLTIATQSRVHTVAGTQSQAATISITGHTVAVTVGADARSGDTIFLTIGGNEIERVISAGFTGGVVNVVLGDTDFTSPSYEGAGHEPGTQVTLTLAITGRLERNIPDASFSATTIQALTDRFESALATAQLADPTLTRPEFETIFFNNIEEYVSGADLRDFNELLDAMGIQTGASGTPASGTLWFQTGANAGQGLHVNIGGVTTRELFGATGELHLLDAVTEGAISETINVIDETGNFGRFGIEAEGITGLLELMDRAATVVATERARLGAVQNRLEFTGNSLQISSENLSAAESRVRDTDMGLEMMRLTQANILQQAAISMLAQGNMAPQSVLQLLG